MRSDILHGGHGGDPAGEGRARPGVLGITSATKTRYGGNGLFQSKIDIFGANF